ncbi:hypothetical protein DSM106972_055500 [Dulcicalothrix desertica PCC 7102]|uniref:Uncharacterized protein n=1 Tax=Dulcicalothrix desertica PCC 7102 TaxID=232991 RepID=A0A433VAW0_9CYAN|nr:hypothetical protein [Dulcicalothrix desertica]RUT03242.1 hypothetical protein DSM106972_055500 [Dulcicalothrix desertica PCC 7102]TWH53613.1 hypothetical protein CAL7102_01577 [Dulcicalothrix desertica PCC 7102]
MTEEEAINLHRKIEAGVKAAVAQAIERHRRLGESISFMKDGKIVTLTAEEIPQIQVDEKL